MKRETKVWATLLLLAGAWLLFRAVTTGMGSAYVQEINGTVSAATPNDNVAGSARFSLSQTVGVWVGAVFTLCILSFLYKDNPLYKFAEAVLVGVSAAYWMVVGFWNVVIPNLLGKIAPSAIQSLLVPGMSPVRDAHWYVNLIPLLLGGMLLWRLAPKGAWIARWPLAFVIGTTAGLRLISFLQADFLSQIRNSIVPLVVVQQSQSFSQNFWQSVQNVILVLSVLATLVYFFFSIEHKGAVGKVAKVGTWVLMITFGAAFGYTVMGRIALLAIRFEYLFDDWLWLIDPAGERIGM